MKLIARFAVGLLIGVVCRGALFDQHAVQNLQGIFTYIVQDVTNGQSYQFLDMFYKDIPILMRETKDKVYSVGPHYLSRIIFMVIQCSIETLVFSIVLYWVSEFNTGGLGFPLFYLPLVTNSVLSAAVGCSLSSIFESVQSAVLVMNPLNRISIIFSGLYLNLGSLPVYTRWLKYLSRFYYGIEAFSILQWTSIDQIGCSEAVLSSSSGYCSATADQVLAQFGYKRSNLAFDFVGLISMFVIFITAGYFGLRHRAKRQAYY